MRKVYILFFACIVTIPLLAQHDKEKMDAFITDLMNRMTLEEKIGQMNLPSDGDIITGLAENSNITQKIRKGQVGGMFNIKGVEKIREIQRIAVEESRMKIPMLFGMDVIHGYETTFPIPLGLSCSWDMELIEESARIAAAEASADGINWTFSPMLDICRDPRWGRISEGNGEDSYLGGQIAKAMVRGYQGADNSFATNRQILACAKHFALYGASEAGRDYNTVDMSRIRMYNEYFYPYQAAVEAGVGSIMASFNVVDGVPAHGNQWLLTEVLRNQWHFNGFVVADYGGISEMSNHGLGDLQTVSALALNAGLDMDMVSEGYLNTLARSLEEGKVTQAQIDQACRYVLEAKYKLGLFEDPYKYCDASRAEKEIYTPENRAVARRTAAESFVLLKNEGDILPLTGQKTIAVVGPLADTRSNMPGTWSVAANLETPATVVEGIQAVAGDQVKVLYAKGSNLTSDPVLEANATIFGRSLNRDNRTEEELRAEALAIAAQADVIVAAVGESSEMSGESSSRADIGIPDVQQRLLQELLKTGKPVVMVLFTGRPLTMVWEDENVPSILNVWFGGSEAAYAIGDVLFGKVNPGGKLTSTFPRHIGQIPVYYNHLSTGRPASDRAFEKFRSNYLDEKNAPLYPFGYGLSYTQFTYSDITLDKTTLTPQGEVTASVTVTNTGTYAGKETVQLYIRDVVASISRPVKELKGFEKIYLEPGESQTVRFTIGTDLLKFYNSDLEYVYEPGEFEVMIGGNSRDVKSATFVLQ
ncbi:MAG: beta-glucosidase BglX [Bacteroides sp.]|nr:beta-glucosidase BglX [Bacteroides sp.]